MDRYTKVNPSTSPTKLGVLSVDRRKYPRYSVELPLDYCRVEGRETFGGIVANASEGGVLVYLPERMEIGTILKIEIFYVSGLELDTIKAYAKIVWSDLAAKTSWGEYRYGLQFQSIDEKDYARLMSLLKEIGK
ncbi:MAG: PilZ domain-containing protein [Thermodesulfobacteriota bacterium]